MGPGHRQHRHLPAFLLLFLARSGETHGAALADFLREKWPPAWPWDPGAVYRALRELEQRGAVTSRWETDVPRPLRLYQLTPAGQDELASWAEDIVARLSNLQYFLAEYRRLPGKEGVGEPPPENE